MFHTVKDLGTVVHTDDGINGTFQIEQAAMLQPEKVLTERWFEKIGENFASEEEFMNTAPILYSIAQELKAIKKLKQMEKLLNV